MSKKILTIFSMIIIIVGILSITFNNHLSKEQIKRLVMNNRKTLERIAYELSLYESDSANIALIRKKQINDLNEHHIKGVQDIYLVGYHIVFYCGGKGFGTETFYHGFYYDLNNNLEHEDGWSYKEHY